MALSTTIKHIDKRTNSVLRFRRRFPKDVAEAIGAPTLQVHIKNREGLPFHREYEAIMQEFDRMVSEERSRIDRNGTRSPVERWHEALRKREELVSETIGLEDDPEFAAKEIAKVLYGQPKNAPFFVGGLGGPGSRCS